MKRFTQMQFVAAAILLLASTMAWSDTSMLRPPKGSKVAIIVFEDLECPQCARAAPLAHEAAKKYDIPLVQHDFPLRQHPWSLEAAIDARYFDTKSPKLGDDYRLYIFQNQNFVTKQNLRGMTEKWAEQHGVTLPFVVDPSGELAAKVEADRAMGERIPLDHTPTIYIVTDAPNVAPITEVKDMTQLYQLLDELTKQVKASSPAPATQAHKSSHKSN
jgi:hypothetical protein